MTLKASGNSGYTPSGYTPIIKRCSYCNRFEINPECKCQEALEQIEKVEL